MALGVYGATVAVPAWPGAVLLLAGIGAMVADIRLRRLGVLTYLGLVAFAGGSFLAYRGVGEAIRTSRG